MLLDTLMVKITGDASGLSKATSQAKTDIEGLDTAANSAGTGFSRLSTLGGAAMSAVGNIVADVVTGAVSQLGSLVSAAAEASDSTQKFASTLSFAGLDTSQIEALTASTQEYADQTVYNLADIRNVTAQLAANGVEGFDQLAVAAGNLNAVAGGNAETFQSVGMVLTQTAGQGKLTTENFNQLSDAIPGAAGKIQQALGDMGAYTGNFRDAMSEGQISAEEFNQAIMNLGMTDAAKEAATSTATFEGAFGNLEAACVGVIQQGLDLIKPAATNAIGGLTDFISAIPNVIGQFGGLISSIQQGVADFQTETGELATAGDAVWVAVQTIGQAMGLTFEQINPFAQALAAFFDTVQDSIAQVAASIQPYLQPLLAAFQSLGTTITTGIMPVFQSFVSFLTQVGYTIMTALTPVLTTLGPIVMQLATQIINGVNQIVAIVLPAVNNIINLLNQFAVVVTPIITAAVTTIMGIFQSVFPAIQQVVSGVFTVIQSIISTVMGVIQGIITVVLGVINGNWNQVMSGLQQIASSIWSGIQGVISGAITAVQGIISAVLGTIQGLWNAAWNAISSFLGGVWSGIQNAVSSGINGVVDFFSGLPGRILGALGNLGSLLVNAGKSIVDGLLNGIKSTIGGVYDFVSGIAGQIASLKGPIPYDLKLLVPNGQAIMKGLFNGIDQGVQSVYDQVGGIGDQIVSELSRSYDIAVKPTLDLDATDIRNIPNQNTTIPGYVSGSADGGKTVNINQQVKVYRSDQDLYTAVPTLFGSARREARMAGI